MLLLPSRRRIRPEMVDCDLENISLSYPYSLQHLYKAIQDNRVDVVRQVLANREKNAPLRADASRAAALFEAVRKNNVEIVVLLCKQETDLNRSSTDDGKMETPLGCAVRLRNDDIVKALLTYGADPTILDSFSRSPLYQAVYFLQHEPAELLLQFGANINTGDKNGFTPLHIACRTHGAADNHRMIAMLLNHGANTNRRTTIGGMLPIDFSMQKGDLVAVQMLLECGSHVGHEARVLQAEVDHERDDTRRAELIAAPMYSLLLRHAIAKKSPRSLQTLALNRIRSHMSELERRSGCSIVRPFAHLNIPISLKDQLIDFVGPERDFLV